MDIERKRAFIIRIMYAAIVLALIYIGIRYVMYAIMPFLIGFTIAYAMRPISKMILNRLNVPKGLVSIIVLLIFYSIIVVLLIFLGTRVFVMLKDFLGSAPDIYANQIEPGLLNLSDSMQSWAGSQSPAMAKNISSLVDSLANSLEGVITTASKGLLSMLTGTISSLPSMIISFLFTIISSFFFAVDYHKIVGFIMRQFPPKTQEIILDVRTYLVGSVFKLFFGYAKIMTITFVELTIGLSILGVENAIMLALVIAIFDILPVLGTGGIMIPWFLITLLNGNVPLAIGLAIIYVVITVIRNIIEPKIVGSTVGLHPIVMLICMFIGAKLFGLLGIFILPITVIVLQKLNESGKVKIFNK